MKTYIHKFGGASIQDEEYIKRIGNIVEEYLEEKSVLVISALGKTTNKIELIIHGYINSNIEESLKHLAELKAQHFSIIRKLFSPEFVSTVIEDISDQFVELEWVLEEPYGGNYDYTYDQMIGIGELCASKILYHNLRINNDLKVVFLDVRDVLKTDDHYRSAAVCWELTSSLIKSTIEHLFINHDYVITQGFIASTDENTTASLGREGSDYTAAIFASCLRSENATVWKNVEGILDSDPALFKDCTRIPKLEYEEALAMCYYGAKVIHPKTLLPLKNANVPLYVKCFLDPKLEGTVVKTFEEVIQYPVVTVIENSNHLLKLSLKSEAFFREIEISNVLQTLKKSDIELRILKIMPLDLILCVHDGLNHLDECLQKLQEEHLVRDNKQVQLITIRHSIIEEEHPFLTGKEIVLKEVGDQVVRFATI